DRSRRLATRPAGSLLILDTQQSAGSSGRLGVDDNPPRVSTMFSSGYANSVWNNDYRQIEDSGRRHVRVEELERSQAQATPRRTATTCSRPLSPRNRSHNSTPLGELLKY